MMMQQRSCRLHLYRYFTLDIFLRLICLPIQDWPSWVQRVPLVGRLGSTMGSAWPPTGWAAPRMPSRCCTKPWRDTEKIVSIPRATLWTALSMLRRAGSHTKMLNPNHPVHANAITLCLNAESLPCWAPSSMQGLCISLLSRCSPPSGTCTRS